MYDRQFPCSVNIVGLRDKRYVTDKFNDLLVVYRCISDGSWVHCAWPITTLPGKPSLLNPFNKKGCAILKPGQYRDTYSIGLHKGKYTALVQSRPVKVYRDNNKDSSYDLSGPLDEGFFGINIHKAGVFSQIVGVSSAGCQVFQKSADFDEFMGICKTAALITEEWGGEATFTYTLIEI